MKLFISTGNSRMEKRWNGREMELEEFIGRISTTIRMDVPRHSSLRTIMSSTIWRNALRG